MYYGTIKTCDIADGDGVRTTLFVSGCRNHCKGCFQPETWNFTYGEPFTKETEDTLIAATDFPYVQGLTLLGGDPFEPENQRELLPFLKRFRKELPGKTIWAYTGYIYENLRTEGNPTRTEVTDEMLSLLDVLVDGPFIEEQKNIALRFRGSENQRLIDMPKTLETGEVALWGTDYRKGPDK